MDGMRAQNILSSIEDCGAQKVKKPTILAHNNL